MTNRAVRWGINLAVLIGLIGAHMIVTVLVLALSLSGFSLDMDTPPPPKTTTDRVIDVLVEIMAFPVATLARMLSRSTGFRVFHSDLFIVLNSIVCGIVLFLVCRWLIQVATSGASRRARRDTQRMYH